MSNNSKQKWNMKKMRKNDREKKNIWKRLRIFIFCKHHILTLTMHGCYWHWYCCLLPVASTEKASQIRIESINLLMKDQNLLYLFDTYTHTEIHTKQNFFSFTNAHHQNAAMINCTLHDYSFVSPKMIKYIRNFLFLPPSNSFVFFPSF